MKNKILYPRFRFRKKIAFQLLDRYFNKLDNFLEIGAGGGDFSMSLSKRINKGTVIDFSKEATEELKTKIKNNKIKIINGDFLSINFQEKYSLILMFDVLEHIKRDDTAFEKVNNLLQKNGIFIFSVPSKMKKWSSSDELVGHYRRYEKNKLIKQLSRHKFEVIKFYSYGFPVLNIISFFSNLLFKINFKKIKYKSDNKSKEASSKNSGLGYVDQFQFRNILKFLINFLFSDSLLNFYVLISRPFNNFNIGDGYLCLARKKKK